MPSKQLIILVHGMGPHPIGKFTEEFKKALSDRAKSFGIADDSFLSKVDYSEFNYSKYFDQIRQQFAENAAARLEGFGFLTGKGFEEKLLKDLTKFESNFGKDEFLYTRWLDVILYATTYFGEKLRLDFSTHFENLRKDYDHKNMHIICHSLGTALVHDALAKYYRKGASSADDIPDLPTGDFNISSLWTFANVSRMVNMLNGLTDPYKSTVVTGSNGCTENFVNVRHKYDPFTWYKTYNRDMQSLETIEDEIIKKANTHDFYEYINEPRAARMILSFIYDEDISGEDFKKGVDEHKKNELKEEVKELKKAIDAVRNDPSKDTIKLAIAEFKKIHDEIAKITS